MSNFIAVGRSNQTYGTCVHANNTGNAVVITVNIAEPVMTPSVVGGTEGVIRVTQKKSGISLVWPDKLNKLKFRLDEGDELWMSCDVQKIVWVSSIK